MFQSYNKSRQVLELVAAVILAELGAEIVYERLAGGIGHRQRVGKACRRKIRVGLCGVLLPHLFTALGDRAYESLPDFFRLDRFFDIGNGFEVDGSLEIFFERMMDKNNLERREM